MGSSSYLLSIIGAAAVRIVLGGDVGVDYNTTALSSWNMDQYGEPQPRTPWALEVRPDIMVAVFNSRQYGYLIGDGSFAQPFAWPPENGDNPEGTGNLMLGGRFRIGRRLIFHPGVFVRLASSNTFIESQDQVQSSEIQGRPFTAIYYGGWLEGEIPVGGRVRLMLRAEVEVWNLEDDEESFFHIPVPVAAVQPNINLEQMFTAWFQVTRRNGVAAEITVEESLFFAEDHPPLDDDDPPAANETQLTMTGRIVYRRAWLPNLVTDLRVGVVALKPRDSEEAEVAADNWTLAGGWQVNVVAGASLAYFGRPRWLALRLSYERNYEQVDFRDSGAVHDSIDLLAAFGPFDGFTISTTLNWSRFAVEVQRLENSKCSLADDQRCNYWASVTRHFNTIGAIVDARYLYEMGNVGFGPFFEGYVYGQIGENLEDVEAGERADNCDQDPVVDSASCYMPPHHQPVEAILMLGFRLQWGYSNARNRHDRSVGGAVSGTRHERRLTMNRMTREQRLIPGYGYRMSAGSDNDDEGLFGRDDPMGRRSGDPLYGDVLEGDAVEGPDGAEAADPNAVPGIEGPEPPQEPEGQYFGEGAVEADSAAPDEEAPDEGAASDAEGAE